MQSDIKVTIPYDDFSKIIDDRQRLAEKIDKVEKAISLCKIREDMGCDKTENLTKFYQDIEKNILTQRGKKLLQKMHIDFSNRLIIEKCFEQWAKEHGVSDCPSNFLAWMYTMGFLYIDRVNEYAGQNEHILKNGG